MSTKLIFVLVLGGTAGVLNAVIHSVCIRMASLLLPDDLFGWVVAYRYSRKRIVNLGVMLIAVVLYLLNEVISPVRLCS